MKLGKRGVGEFYWRNWAEVFIIILIMIGFLVSIVIRSAWLSYLIIFLAGLMGGRVIAKRHKRQPLLPYFLIIIGFLFGYLLGALVFEINKKVLVLLFIIGGIISFYIHKKGYIE
jgi:energy-coupling factor transporter transmembrane protein EcfT